MKCYVASDAVPPKDGASPSVRKFVSLQSRLISGEHAHRQFLEDVVVLLLKLLRLLQRGRQMTELGRHLQTLELHPLLVLEHKTMGS